VEGLDAARLSRTFLSAHHYIYPQQSI
jgi:hypothetical protein